MRRAARRRRRRLPGLTPLIDVVFILLFFFMLASSLQPKRTLELHAEGAAGAASGEDASLARIRVGQGALRLGGERLALAALADALMARRETAPSLRVRVRPAPGVSLQRTVAVLEEVAAAGVRDVALERPR